MRVCLVRILMSAAFLAAGCARVPSGNDGQLQSYPYPAIEAGWIRNGEAIEYDGHQWFPVDDIENLLDSEVCQIGEYKGAQIFVDRMDAKPYDRIYTKFARGKFRYFERPHND